MSTKRFDEFMPEIQQLMAEGRALIQVVSDHQWIVADWLLGWEGKVGPEAYDFAEKATGYARKTLQEWASVARHVSMRMEDLSFNHHQVVAPLAPEAQKRCLEIAAARKMSVAQLREMARWEPRPLIINSESEGPGTAPAEFRFRFNYGKELHLLEIMAQQLGFTSDETNSGVGRLIHHLVVAYLKDHRDLLESANAEYETLTKLKATSEVSNAMV